MTEEITQEPQVETPEVELPSGEVPEKTPEEVIAELTAERDRVSKDYKELEKLMGRKGQEEGDRKKAEQEALEQAERQATKDKFIKESLDDVVNSGMTITEDVKNKMLELGVDETELKLKAYEHKEKLESVISIFGDREVYEEALVVGSESNMSQEQLAAIGLKTLYQEKVNSGEHTKRITGVSNPAPANRGYESFSDYSKDLRWAGRDAKKLQAVRGKVAQTRAGILE